MAERENITSEERLKLLKRLMSKGATLKEAAIAAGLDPDEVQSKLGPPKPAQAPKKLPKPKKTWSDDEVEMLKKKGATATADALGITRDSAASKLFRVRQEEARQKREEHRKEVEAQLAAREKDREQEQEQSGEEPTPSRPGYVRRLYEGAKGYGKLGAKLAFRVGRDTAVEGIRNNFGVVGDHLIRRIRDRAAGRQTPSAVRSFAASSLSSNFGIVGRNIAMIMRESDREAAKLAKKSAAALKKSEEKIVKAAKKLSDSVEDASDSGSDPKRARKSTTASSARNIIQAATASRRPSLKRALVTGGLAAVGGAATYAAYQYLKKPDESKELGDFKKSAKEMEFKADTIEFEADSIKIETRRGITQAGTPTAAPQAQSRPSGSLGRDMSTSPAPGTPGSYGPPERQQPTSYAPSSGPQTNPQTPTPTIPGAPPGYQDAAPPPAPNYNPLQDQNFGRPGYAPPSVVPQPQMGWKPSPGNASPQVPIGTPGPVAGPPPNRPTLSQQTNSTPNDRAGSWMSFFQRPPEQGGMGLNREKSAAMVAMMMGESGRNLNPSILGDYQGGRPTSGGTAQWHDTSPGRGRWTNLQNFAAARGKPWTDLETQQQFWKHETETTHKSAWASIQNARTGPEALAAGVRNFEVPRFPDAEIANRMGHYNYLMSQPQTPLTPTPQSAQPQQATPGAQRVGPFAAIPGNQQAPALGMTSTLGPERFSVRPGVDTNVDPRLIEIARQSSRSLPEGWRAELSSGFRGGPNQSMHGKQRAIDMTLIDPSGKRIPNYQTGSTFRTYEEFAQTMRRNQMSMHPELNNEFRWGGYFTGGKGNPFGGYGANDQMHFDLGGKLIGPGGAGTWEQGLIGPYRGVFDKGGPSSVGMNQLPPPVTPPSAIQTAGMNLATDPRPQGERLLESSNERSIQDSMPRSDGLTTVPRSQPNNGDGSPVTANQEQTEPPPTSIKDHFSEGFPGLGKDVTSADFGLGN